MVAERLPGVMRLGASGPEGKQKPMKKTITAAAIGGALLAGSLLGCGPASASGPYANCSEAHADGRYDIPQGDPDYWPGGDRDHDGIACES